MLFKYSTIIVEKFKILGCFIIISNDMRFTISRKFINDKD